jgi:ABC-2 type transport system permease protein
VKKNPPSTPAHPSAPPDPSDPSDLSAQSDQPVPSSATLPSAPPSSAFSLRRLRALCRKETLQILRDPTSILIAFILPVVMLFIYGYGINLDTGRARVGLLCEDTAPDARQFAASLTASPYLNITAHDSLPAISDALTRSRIRGFVVIPSDFSAKLRRAESALAAGETPDPAPLQLIIDGSEPNTANFVQAYVTGAWQDWLLRRAAARGQTAPPAISIENTFWYNPVAESRNYLIPGSITIIMTVIGALLTALVVAREWERGTMEALLSTPVTRAELLLGKIIPCYLLGMIVLLLCIAVARHLMGVPFRGSPLPILACGTLFLLSVLGMGLLISTATRNQFNSAQIALFTAFLPALMFSGFLFEISSMPGVLRAVSAIVPARYFVTSIQTLSQVGDAWPVIRRSLLFLACTSALFLGLTAKLTRKRLE